jgi:hypothetical protein
VYGTWKAAVRTVDSPATPAVSITPDADPAKNGFNFGAGADPLPAALASIKNQGYNTEVVWNLALIPGHNYRIQVIVHDGDQNKVGGDVGEACVDYCAGGDNPPPPPGDGGPPDTTTNPPPPSCPPDSHLCGNAEPTYTCPTGQICNLGCCMWIG